MLLLKEKRRNAVTKQHISGTPVVELPPPGEPAMQAEGAQTRQPKRAALKYLSEVMGNIVNYFVVNYVVKLSN